MRHPWILLLTLAACEVGEIDDNEDALGGLRAGGDPCATEKVKKAPKLKASGDGHHFIGTNKRDIIFGTNGVDVINGNGGDDLICAFGGDDIIDGGDGRDVIVAGNGADVVHGRGGSDYIYGGPGNDTLFGDILDDHLYGQAGNDILIGGHGTDYMDGGADDDFMRGDTGNDTFLGDEGYDIASFATALPPGQPEVKNDGSLNVIFGVNVKFDDTCKNNGGGCADGDGGNEEIRGVEQIVGSSFSDRIVAPGRDVPATLGDATPTPTSYVSFVAALDQANRIVDLGVVVLGTAGPEGYGIYGSPGVVKVTSTRALAAGEGCVSLDATTVRCDFGAYLSTRGHRDDPFHFVLGWGDAGDDSFQFFGDFPKNFETHVSGGEGSDHLVGGAEQDVFFSGVTGEDHLEGRDGDDALLGESHHTLAWADDKRPEASTYNDGADILDGGEGNDQLVVDYVCGGHRFIGGAGHDIAGFARSGKNAIHAQLGGPSKVQSKWYGRAANMNLCGNLEGRWTSWKTGEAADLEVLEASDGPDHLWGDDRNNVIWGRGGGDEIFGLDGDDEILGANGNDLIDPGEGDDVVKLGEGH